MSLWLCLNVTSTRLCLLMARGAPSPPAPLPPGTKKVPKAYVVAVSPVRPNLAAVGANTGMAFMTFDRMYPLPVAPLPLINLAQAHDSPALRLPHEPVAVSYVAHIGDAVWLVSCTAVDKVRRAGREQHVWLCQIYSHKGRRIPSDIAWLFADQALVPAEQPMRVSAPAS